ncbi:MAG: EamA family transporter [Anaerolineales bacterium]|jgi:transporter family protein
MKSWLVPVLGAFVFWGLWGFLPKITTRTISPMSAMIFEAVGGMLVAIIALLSGGYRLELTRQGVFLALLTGIFGILGAWTYLQAVSTGKVSLVVSFTALYPIMSIILAVFFLGESLSVRQGAGIFFALLSMLLIAA